MQGCIFLFNKECIIPKTFLKSCCAIIQNVLPSYLPQNRFPKPVFLQLNPVPQYKEILFCRCKKNPPPPVLATEKIAFRLIAHVVHMMGAANILQLSQQFLPYKMALKEIYTPEDHAVPPSVDRTDPPSVSVDCGSCICPLAPSSTYHLPPRPHPSYLSI